MLEVIITWICFFLIYLGYKYLRKKYKKNIDLSLGVSEINEIKLLIEKKQFDEAERLILKLNADNLTQTLDCIGLTINTSVLLEWKEKSKNIEISNLFLAVHFNHKAWIARSHSFSRFVSKKNEDKFFDYQSKSVEYFEQISEPSVFISEVYSRLIRVEMGYYGYCDEVAYNFEKAINIDETNLWAYIHYCEAIQPKWGGNLELISKLLKSLPDITLIQHTVRLKLLLDSFIISENYFGGSMIHLENIAKDELQKTDKELSNKSISSIHRFMLYNYMKLLADQVDNNELAKKYKALSKNYHTLYPYGVII